LGDITQTGTGRTEYDSVGSAGSGRGGLAPGNQNACNAAANGAGGKVLFEY